MTREMSEKPKISLVSGICVQHDAISESVIGTWHAIHRAFNVRSQLYSYACHFPEVDHCLVRGVSDLLQDRHFLESNLIIYDFGIYFELFNSIFALPSSIKTVVRYHNITPAELLPASQRPIIDRSLRQISNVAAADKVWADSEFNRNDLIDYGLPGDNISVEPLYVRSSLKLGRVDRPHDGQVARILFVGRFVQSKGIIDLIDAVVAARAAIGPCFHLRLAGNTTFSDPALIAQLQSRIAAENLTDLVEFVGSVSDERLAVLYMGADLFILPSYHEGFCVPVIEAMMAGAVPIVYDAGNLPGIVRDFGIVVPVGDKVGLGRALARGISLVRESTDNFPLNTTYRSRALYKNAVANYLIQFGYDAFSARTEMRVRDVLMS